MLPKELFSIEDMELAGIVVDSQSLSPIEKVSILDNNNKKIGETDSNGYF